MRIRIAPISLAFALFVAGNITVFTINGCGRDPQANLRTASDALLSAVNMAESGDYIEALRVARGALYAQQMIGNDSLCAETSMLLGNIYRQLSDVDSSELSYRSGINYAEAASDRRLRFRNTIGFAALLADMGRNDEAVALAGEAYPLARFSADTVSMFRSLMILLQAHRRLGNVPDARRTLGLLFNLDSSAFQGKGEVELRDIELQLLGEHGTVDSARAVHITASQRFIRSGDHAGLARLQGAWAQVQFSAGLYDSAYRSFTQVLASDALNDDPSLKRMILTQLGTLQYRKANYEDARRFYFEALRLMKEDHFMPARLILELQIIACEWKFRLSRNLPIPDELIARCNAARDSSSAVHFRPGVVFGSFLCGRLYAARGDSTAAWKFYIAASERYSENTMSFLPEELGGLLRAFLDREGTSWFQAAINLACANGMTDTAFTLDESADQDGICSFYRLLPITAGNVDLESRIRMVQQTRQKLTLVERDIVQGTSIRTIHREPFLSRRAHILQRRREEIGSAATAVSALSVPYGFLLSSEVPKLEKVRESIPVRGALLKYIDTGEQIYALVVRKDTAFLRKLPGGRSSIVSLAEDYTSAVSTTGAEETGILRQRADNRKRIEDLSQLLHSLLLDPLEDLLRPMETIYIRLPDSFTWLPVHTLLRSGPGGRLAFAQRFRISYLPVASVLLFPSIPERAPLQVVGFGHRGSSGWDVEYELADIRSFYEKAPMLFDSLATIAKLKEKRPDVLAISAVFRIDETRPWRSGILTAAGRIQGTFRLSALGQFAATPVPQTVVMSDVSGMPGVLRSYVPLLFLANGSRTVIGTLWRGDRKAKKFFGEVFYTSSFNGSNGPDAYQRAVIATATSREYGGADRWGLYYRFGK